MTRNKRNKGKSTKRRKPKTLFESPEDKYRKLKLEVEKQSKDLKGFQQNLDSLSKSHANHLSLLSNFARHDLKNYTHSIDGIVSTCNASDITDDQLESIRLNIKFIRETLNDFAKLIVHDEGSNCEFEDLVTAIHTINRTSFAETSIEFVVTNNVDITFNIPFTIMFQLLNNLIVNAIKSFEGHTEKRRAIALEAYVDADQLVIEVSDNGKNIEDANKKTLFDYGFSTTGGTGIGLYHAKHLCESNNGSIVYCDRDDSELNKCFIITLPITKE